MLEKSMEEKLVKYLRCPASLAAGEEAELRLVGHKLVNKSGREYAIIDDIPSMVILDDERNFYAMELFKNQAKEYDHYQHLSFETFYKKENEVRLSLIKQLNLEEAQEVLEVNAGTGRDSILIHGELQKAGGGNLHVQDISLDMLKVLQGKVDKNSIFITHSNACKLPYDNETFDCIYSFGGVGMNTYADNKMIFKEMVRVAKIGAKVVIGGLSMAPWLYETEYAKILINQNEHYKNIVQLEDIPIEAREVSLSWILNGAGFSLTFTIGQGEPEANFDFPIPGVRGGTLRTRYYGKLEGVSSETKELAYQAQKLMNISMYEYLNQIITEASNKVLEGKKDEMEKDGSDL